MPRVIISLKEGADPGQVDAERRKVTDQGGKIVHEYTLIKGFAAEFPEGAVHSMASNDHVNVEQDKTVTTQKA